MTPAEAKDAFEDAFNLADTRHVEGEPAHLALDHHRRWKLYRWANMLAGYYGARIYLCGSALRDGNIEPRDWDIRVVLTREDFERRFGNPDAWVDQGCTGAWDSVRWRWSEECVKESRAGYRNTGLNIDFQIQPPATWNACRSGGSRALRIDASPNAPPAPDEP